MPSPLSVKVTPAGSAPDSFSAGTGRPVVVTVVVKATPAVAAAVAALVIAGAVFCCSTVEPLPATEVQPESVPP